MSRQSGGSVQRLIIVSNRLPITVEMRAGSVSVKGSVGGVATGLGSFHDTHESIWVGWAEVPESRLSTENREIIRTELTGSHRCMPVFLTAADIRGFYAGFSNGTLWPLFHHFARYAEFVAANWRAYERVNRKYCDAVLEVARPGDTIWVQDYQLMLLPQMLRERLPDASIGFFLHIPFPSSEVFRILPWRREILEGLLGSDLIGFHTYDYVRAFLASTRRILGLDEQYGRLLVDERLVTVDAFPMGIDYERYRQGAEAPAARKSARRVTAADAGRKIILSVDRLDYTKGIPERLLAYDEFLVRHPQWREKVTLVCVAVPSRTRVEEYRRLKAQVERLVGSINGKHGTVDWAPVRYLYRSLSFHTLSGMYAAADVAFITPLRDGMNLIAKEYVAARGDNGGVLVLSEMAGAARELAEALQVNPYDLDGMVEALGTALEMPIEMQRERMEAMQHRVSRYTVSRWAEEFLNSVERVKMLQLSHDEHVLHAPARERLVDAYRNTAHRLIMLDYDGTLVPFAPTPGQAAPPPRVHELLGRLAADPRNEVVIISGRERASLEEWLGDLPIDLVAEHGAWLRGHSGQWVAAEPMSDDWKPRVRPVLDLFVDRTPGSFIEEKHYSMAWHYRAIHPSHGQARAAEMKESLAALARDLDLTVLEGNRVLEIKSARVNKGTAAHRWMCREDDDFVLAIGDDRTDEDMFEMAPERAWTIKVGTGPTHASFSVREVADVQDLLNRLVEADTQ
jgi:trehalose 6-phosphate synthase/phosphatase